MENTEYIKENYKWQDLLGIVHKLRQPDGCPWDRQQTYESMKKCVQDEAQEVIEAVDNKDFINLREELGDLLLQVLMYSEIAAEREEFTLDDVVDELAKKLVRRHPHVFGGQPAAQTPQEGLSVWKSVKIQEKMERLKEYELMYEQRRITLEVLEKQRERCRKLTEQ